jgi:DNA-binding transcriptional ArsR family regulator
MDSSEIEQNLQSKILKLALNNKQIAIAVLGQALLDEGGIGAQSITIFYTNKGEAYHLWKIADSLGYANSFRKKKHRNHFHYGFSIKASKRRELYDQIGPLPNPVKDKVFRHLANRKGGRNIRGKGETKTRILQSLRIKPKTVLELMLELNTSASTMRRHLQQLQTKGLVEKVGKDVDAFQKSLRTANLWKAS